jgi:hypothetical protein
VSADGGVSLIRKATGRQQCRPVAIDKLVNWRFAEERLG